MPLVQTNKAMS